MNFIKRFYYSLHQKDPLHPMHWDRPFPQARFRTLTDADIPQCLEIYALNEKNRFPEGEIGRYEWSLRQRTSYYLVAEVDGRIMSTAGLSFMRRPDVPVLCYGMVHPEVQGQGYGTVQTLLRVASLDPHVARQLVFIFGIPKSLSFYRRFGFQPVAHWKDRQGNQHPLSQLDLTFLDIRACKQRLLKKGVQFDFDNVVIPAAQENASAEEGSMVTEIVPITNRQ